MVSSEVDAALRQLRAGVDALLGADLSGLAAAEVTELLSGLEVQRRRLPGVDHRVLAEVADRGLAGDYGRTSTADLLVTLLRVSPAEAKRRVADATDLGPRHAVTGEVLPPLLPRVTAAIRAGDISAGHTAVIIKCLDHIPADLAAEATPVAEQVLVQAARHQHPVALARTAHLLLARLDPDGTEPREEEAERRRSFTLIKRADGSAIPRGLWTAELTAAWETILDSLAAPPPATDGMPDDRSAGQRRHDAMADAAHRLLRSATLPAAGGMPVTILATATISDLTAGTGIARTGHGDPLSVQQLLDLATEAEIIPVVFNEAGGVLAFGRGQRLASRGQRLALAARDHGCTFPGCDRPAAWTEVHHITPWIHGGPTDLDNMCLLCRFHHREFERRGWQVRIHDGIPQWIPPPWIDPERKPQRNAVHHLPDLAFTA
jgi:hypothetical protein